jgi:predicted transcriptional regulator
MIRNCKDKQLNIILDILTILEEEAMEDFSEWLDTIYPFTKNLMSKLIDSLQSRDLLRKYKNNEKDMNSLDIS